MACGYSLYGGKEDVREREKVIVKRMRNKERAIGNEDKW